MIREVVLKPYQKSIESHVAAPYVGARQVDAAWNLDPEAELGPML